MVHKCNVGRYSTQQSNIHIPIKSTFSLQRPTRNDQHADEPWTKLQEPLSICLSCFLSPHSPLDGRVGSTVHVQEPNRNPANRADSVDHTRGMHDRRGSLVWLGLNSRLQAAGCCGVGVCLVYYLHVCLSMVCLCSTLLLLLLCNWASSRTRLSRKFENSAP